MQKRSRRKKYKSITYSYGYVYERDGVAYMDIKGKVTSMKMQFTPANKPEMLRKLDETIYYIENPEINKVNTKLTVSELIEEFLNIPKNNTKSRIERLNYSNRDFLPTDFPIDQIDNIRKEINVNLSKSTLHQNYNRKNLQALQGVFKYGVDEGYIDRNPITNSMIPAEKAPEKLNYKPEDLENLIKYYEVTDRELHLLFRLIKIIGPRIEETLKLKWSEIDDNLLMIHGKGNRNRRIPIELSDELSIIMKELKTFDNEDFVFRWRTRNTPGAKAMRAAKELGFYEKGKSLHSIRRFAENDFIHNQEYNDEVVAMLFGHSVITQKKHYVEEMSEEKFHSKLLSMKVNKQ